MGLFVFQSPLFFFCFVLYSEEAPSLSADHGSGETPRRELGVGIEDKGSDFKILTSKSTGRFLFSNALN